MTDIPYMLEIFLGIGILAFAVAIGLIATSTKRMIKENTSTCPQDHVQTFLERKGLL